MNYQTDYFFLFITKHSSSFMTVFCVMIASLTQIGKPKKFYDMIVKRKKLGHPPFSLVGGMQDHMTVFALTHPRTIITTANS